MNDQIKSAMIEQNQEQLVNALANAIQVMQEGLNRAKRHKNAANVLTDISWSFATFSNRISDAINIEADILKLKAK